MAVPINQLRIYVQARQAEDCIYEIVKALPDELEYPLGDELRRSSAAVCHYVSEVHKFYSYNLKLDALARARRAAERTEELLGEVPPALIQGPIPSYDGIIKQSWALVRYLQGQRDLRQQAARVAATDEQVAARAFAA